MTTLRISTDVIPARQRVAVWREMYGRDVLRLEVEPLRGEPFRSQLTAQMLPGLGVVSARSSAFRVGRTRALLADGDDSFILQISNRAGLAAQLGRDVEVAGNDAILLSNADVGTFTFPRTADIIALRLPRAVLSPMLKEPNVLVRSIPRQTEGLSLLVRYLDILNDDISAAAPQLQRLVVGHVYDLAALVLGATRDAAYAAAGRGLRAARLHAIKKDIFSNLDRPELNIAAVASRQSVTPRYIQQLFSSEGTTFTDFVRAERLERAFRAFDNARFAQKAISTIAYDCGFGDLSHFNRMFRRRYGLSPSDVRAAVQSEDV